MHDELATLAERVSDEVTPAARELAALAETVILGRAAADGWSPSQAEWLVKLALEPLFQAVADRVPGPDALDEAYTQARRRLSISYFQDALDRGKRPMEAFLTVIDLERQVAERGGMAPPDYPDSALKPACAKVEGAALQGYRAADLVRIGYAVLHRQLGRG